MIKASGRKILVAKVVGQLLFLYAFLAWLDGVIIQFVDPQWLPLPVSHLLSWMRTDNFTIICFFASAFGFLMWRLAAEQMKFEKNKTATH